MLINSNLSINIIAESVGFSNPYYFSSVFKKQYLFSPKRYRIVQRDLKKMEGKGLVSRKRSEFDERNLTVTITEKGMQLRDAAVEIPAQMVKCNALDAEESATLYKLLYKIMDAAQ